MRSSFLGIQGASLAGGSEILFQGQGMSHTAEDFQVIFTSSLYSFEAVGPAVSKDNSFNSNTAYGKLEYTTPSLMTLFNQPLESFDTIDWISFDLSLINSIAETGRANPLSCTTWTKSNCKIIMSRSYTPILYYLTPRVVHHGSEVSFVVDPRSAQDYRQTADLPFVEARIDQQTINFELYVSEDTVLNGGSKNSVRSNVFNVKPNPSSQVNLKWRVGNSLHDESQMLQCDITNTTCYKVKVVPVINTVSASTGYTTGGQILEINGYGFASDNIVVKVDGVSCQVISHQTEKLICRTGAQLSPSTDSTFVGSQGIKRSYYNFSSATPVSWSRLQTEQPQVRTIALNLEAPQNQKDGYAGNLYTGYFKPPVSGNYRFYMSCDDGCILYLGNANKDPSTKTEILRSLGVSSSRGYITPDGSKQSQYIPLLADSYYYIETQHLQYGGADHISVAVEIDRQSPGHQHAMREVQRLSINPTNVREKSILTILNPDDGYFNLNLFIPATQLYFSANFISCKVSASGLKSAIQGFYSTNYGASITVVLVMYDASDLVVTSQSLSVKNVYTITVNKALTSDTVTMQPSFPDKKSASIISFTLPKNSQQSTTTLKGSFAITCILSNGDTNDTAEIPITSYIYQIVNKIVQACPNYRDRIDVWDGPAYQYNVDGRDLMIRFTDVNSDVQQFTIKDFPTNPTTGNNITFNAETVIPYARSLFYEPIPFELLFTDEFTPQVLVSVDGLPAVCASLSCGYTYETSVSSITAFSLSGLSLTITGTNLPITSDLVSIFYSNVKCTPTTVSTTQILCTLASIVAGTWLPVVTDVHGLIPLDASLTQQTVALTVTSLSPDSSLNPNGESTMTITGQNFPTSLIDGSTISITFSDATICQVLSSTSTQITCLTPHFVLPDSTLTLTVTINDQIDSSQTVLISASPATVTSLSPSNVSPVLKSVIVLQVCAFFTGTLTINDLSVKLVDSNVTSGYTKSINVVAVDDLARTISIKYGGIYSGVYNIVVFSQTYGKFKTTSVQLTVQGQVTSFSPKQGSVYGGTLITINGFNFSTDITENPVQIGTTDCLVQTSSNNVITCLTLAQDLSSTNVQEELITFLKTSEEAICNTGSDCKFTWLQDADLPTLDSYTIAYNSVVGEYQITLVGSGFPTDVSLVTFIIDGYAQTVTSTSDTEIKITIIRVLSQSTTNIQFILPAGTPKGASLLYTQGITLNPIIISTTPATGSPAGSVLTATIKGLGISSTSVTLVTSSGTDICATVTVTDYGVVQCITKVLTVASTTLRAKVGTNQYQCSTLSNCAYQTSASYPNVASLVASGDMTSLIITGTNFLTTNYDAQVSYAGINANTVTFDSTTLTAVWNTGVPISSLAISPIVTFTSQLTTEKHWAVVTGTLANALTVTTLASNVQCSFAGGCSLTLDAPGLASSLAKSTNSIQVCGNICTLQTSLSTSSSVSCKVPSLTTTYSITNYNIQSEQYLMGSMFGTNSTSLSTLTDLVNQNTYVDTSSTCNFGTYFTSGHIGQLSEVKYFMPVFDRTKFVGLLKFQGSQDGITYTDIFTVGQEIHEGWNYYDYQSSNLLYRYYRFQGNGVGSCGLGEINFRGVEAISDNNSSYICSATLNLDGQEAISLTGSVTYSSIKTPLLSSISPRYGKVQGGDTITFTGTGFSSTNSDYTITIDGIVCAVQSASLTEVICITGKRPGLFPEPTLMFNIAGKGSVALQNLVFRYVNYWSLIDTWGGEFLPIEGETVYIPPGLHLLVDVDSTPILNAVLVEGSLIFPSDSNENHLRTFDAHYIMVKGGYMEVGTEDFPYTSKLIITMHSSKQSPEIPIYGNKCIAVRNGILDFHGVPREPTWTVLDSTALAGSTTITLQGAIDWKVGEVIVVAPSGYDNREAEQRTIVSVDRTNPIKPIITLDSALTFKHYSAIETYGTETIEMRAEVALITRNVVYRGDPETSSINEYGAHIMLHSMGDESLIGRIEYIELRDVGQAFQLGRYPLHFHMIGTVHNSYIRGNAIHHTYNRAVTIHGVHYLRIIRNVAYFTMGHTFFIEDAVETKNYLEKNLAIQTMASFSLLITDQTPASFWITHPDNIFRGNHAAGSDRYGYWYDTKPHPMGPSFSPDICPENCQLGEFTNNVAHSNGKYGLRIFHKLLPRVNPCQPLFYNASNVYDQYASNPLITANFINFTSWKNVHVGAIAEQVGDVRFVNFKVADNLVAGIEFSLTGDVMDGRTQIKNALVIGHSENAEYITMTSNFHGIITPRSENFQVNGAKFFNYDQPGHAALGSCSHCFHPASTDSGARTISFSQIYFDSTVSTRIRYQFPYKDIFYDMDGSLTGQEAKSWATPYWPHNVQPECQVDNQTYDGILCNSQVEIRRLVMYNYAPSIFELTEFKIVKFDDNLYTNTNKSYYLSTRDNVADYSSIPFKMSKDPKNSWAVPFVTGHKYKTHWRYGLDFTKMQIDLSPKWTITDKNVYLVFNFTDVRAQVDFVTGGENVQNTTLLTKPYALLQTGDNVVYNDTPTREIHVLINGKNTSRTNLVMTGYRCVGSCLTGINETAVETTFRRWSNRLSWPSGAVPIANESVEILPGWNMLYDVAEVDSHILSMLQINGRLTFEDGVKDLHLKSKYIFVRAGELIIGTATTPFVKNAKITLYGEKANAQIVYDNAIEAGNKILANTGNISIYGTPRIFMSRLTQTVQPGSTTIKVGLNLGWKAGDQLGLSPTTLRFNDTDYAIITSYNDATGDIVLDRQLNAYHYGASLSTGPSYNGVDMRGEVYLLTRNVKISGEDIEAWGCQIVTSDFVEISGVIRKGMTYINSAEIYNCSQFDTQKGAIRFDGATRAWSEITNSAIHHGLGYGVNIQSSSNVKLTNNTIFTFKKRGVNVISSSNITIDGNHISDVDDRQLNLVDHLFEATAGVVVCAEKDDSCAGISVVNNVVSGCVFSGFITYGQDCGNYTQTVFRDNIAHSIRDTGAIMFLDPTSTTQKDCMEVTRFTAYKCGLDGAISYNNFNKKVIFSNMTFIDNGYSGTIMIGQEDDILEAQMKDTMIYGETLAQDCFYEHQCLYEGGGDSCKPRNGLMLSYFTKTGKDPLPKMASAIPISRIKIDASYGGYTTYTNLQFFNFTKNITFCGNTQKLFVLNPTAADYIPRAKFIKTRFENVHQDAMSYLFTPPDSWANLDDCGNFPCTAPNNALLQFENSIFAGTVRPEYTVKNFQILPYNPSTVNGYKSCQRVITWNAYYCNNDNLGVLLFESIDEDKKKRMISPIYVKNNASGSLNTLNTFMDHIWDGFYTGQLRLARWPTTIQTGASETYDIMYSGTPPSNQRMTLQADASAVVIRIKYTKTGAYAITDFKGNTYKANGWSDTLKTYDTIKRTKCGENRYLGVENTLEFYITSGCSLMIKSLDSIRTSVRLQWTLNEFYADGGTTKFIDRLSAVLGIHASTVKIVAVYQGSVIIDFKVIPDGTDTVTSINTRLSTVLKANATFLGAPILSASVAGVPIITDPATTTTNNNGNTGTTTPTVNNGGTTGTTNQGTTTKTGVVVQDSGSSGNQDQAKLIIIFAVIVIVIIAGGIASYFIYRRYKKNQFNGTSKSKTLNIQSKQLGQNSDVSADHAQDAEEYPPQYHPKAELGNIFGNRQMKMNNADELQEGQDSHIENNDTENLDDDGNHIHIDTDQSHNDNDGSSPHKTYERSPLHANSSTILDNPALSKKRSSLRIQDLENGGTKIYQNVKQ